MERLENFPHFGKYYSAIQAFLIFVILHLLSVVNFAIYAIVRSICVAICFLSNTKYTFLNYLSTSLDENFVESMPLHTFAVTLAIKGDISLQNLRELVQKNLIEAKSKLNPQKRKYPELTQYLTTFLCFRVWKNDPNFLIENHVFEQHIVSERIDLEDVYEMLLNSTYKKQSSPWEIILIKNKKCNKSIIACRLHHTLGDGKSVLKLIVEGLGSKKVEASNENKISIPFLSKLVFYLTFPLKYIFELGKLGLLIIESYEHPWTLKTNPEKCSKHIVAFSEKLLLSDIKQVAVKNGVSVSAVLHGIIAGAIRTYFEGTNEQCDKELAVALSLPKPNHPDGLCNHLFQGIMPLPVHKSCSVDRLKECNKAFTAIKTTQQSIYLDFAAWITGSLLYPFNRLLKKAVVIMPVGIGNVAGDQTGFSVGEMECVDFRATVGCGLIGVTFVAFSYKDALRVAVIAKSAVLQKDGAKKMAASLSVELNNFKLKYL